MNSEPIFTTRVLKIVASIPPGQVLTYQEVARRAGSPRAFRAVGSILSKNFNPEIPCHRVIRSSGELGEYNRGRQQKEQLLAKEGFLGIRK
jgi:methylated-DNA-[protein]-cysteine S-methyltransferase